MTIASIEEALAEAEGAKIIEDRMAAMLPELTVWARYMAARFNAPVYLLGSVLTNPECRDIDIRIVVQDHELAARYGHTLAQQEFAESHPYRKRRGTTSANVVRYSEDGPTQRQIDDTAKFTSHLSIKLQHNFDVQIVPDSWWRNDIYPAPKLLAGPSPRWWIYSAVVPNEVRVPYDDYMALINRSRESHD